MKKFRELIVWVLTHVFAPFFAWSGYGVQTSCGRTTGKGPFRTALVPTEPSLGFRPAWLRDVGISIQKFFGRRIVQLIFRLSLVPFTIYLVYWGYVLLTGGTIPDATFYLPNGHVLFAVSRLTDIPGVLIIIAVLVGSILGTVKVLCVKEPSQDNTVESMFIISCACLIFMLIFGLCASPWSIGPPVVGNKVTGQQGNMIASIPIFLLIFSGLGLVWGIATLCVRQPQSQSIFWRWLLLSHMALFATTTLVSDFAEGFAVGVVKMAIAWAAFSAPIFIILLVKGIFTSLHPVVRKIGQALKKIGSWFIAADVVDEKEADD